VTSSSLRRSKNAGKYFSSSTSTVNIEPTPVQGLQSDSQASAHVGGRQQQSSLDQLPAPMPPGLFEGFQIKRPDILKIPL